MEKFMKENKEKQQKLFEDKIKPLLLYVGTIGAILMSIAYFIVVLVLVFGFEVKSPTQSIIFATINAIVGLVIMQFLKVQGIAFAKEIPENQEVLKKYYTKRKKKKSYDISYYWIKSIIEDVLAKGLGIAVTSAGLIYIVVEGSQDYNLILLAVVNLIMFICFGFISLTKSYDFFNDNYIPYVKDQIELKEKVLKEKKEAENGIKNSNEWSGSDITQLTRTSSEE